jgi:hypothetical protein
MLPSPYLCISNFYVDKEAIRFSIPKTSNTHVDFLKISRKHDYSPVNKLCSAATLNARRSGSTYYKPRRLNTLRNIYPQAYKS